jgi:hypothetical protein
MSADPVRPIAVSCNEAPRYVPLKPSTLRLYIRKGILPAARLGRKRVILLSDLEKLCRDGCPSRDDL